MPQKSRLLTPGPTPLPDRVRLAMARDMIHHRKPEFIKLFGDIQKNLQILFGTNGPVISLTASGSGAMTAAIANLFTAGESVITVEGGKFGERWTKICASMGVKPLPLSVPWGESVQVERIERLLDTTPGIAGICVQVSETSTGVMHPVKELAALAQKRGILLIADGISAVSISPCPMDAWGIDCLLTGSQKGLMLPPGLSFIALSSRAWKKTESLPCHNFYFDLAAERDSSASCQTNFTPPISLLFGLAESLSLMLEEGLDAIYQKQWAMTRMARAGVDALGFPFLAKTDFTWGLTSLMLPFGVSASPLLAHAAEKYGVVMAAGMGHMKESCIRIGHMGWVDAADIAFGLYALASSFKAMGGHIGSSDYLERAFTAYEAALLEPLPIQ
ncbi:aminotransferase [Deltaproteobacteria bacterium]|nr:aminotransferase [Deltaproteobacteria bacterium]